MEISRAGTIRGTGNTGAHANGAGRPLPVWRTRLKKVKLIKNRI